MAATQSFYLARCLHISHQPARTAKSCLKELRTYEPRLFLAGNASANQSVGEGHEFRILSLRPYYTPSNAAPEWQAMCVGRRNRELVVACPLEGLVRRVTAQQVHPSLLVSTIVLKQTFNFRLIVSSRISLAHYSLDNGVIQ